MSTRSPVAVFLAASALLSLNTIQPGVGQASESERNESLGSGQQRISEQQYAFHHKKKKAPHSHQEQTKMGGLKEWTTDQGVEEEGQLDESAKRAAKKAQKQDVCIPIGEGENCW